MAAKRRLRERRHAAELKRADAAEAAGDAHPERLAASTDLHEERLNTVVETLLGSGATKVLDLGCGSGGLLERLLAEGQFTEVVGLDSSIEALNRAERLLDDRGAVGAGRLSLIHGSFTDPNATLGGFDAAVMVETIEHVPPARLSNVEHAVFTRWRPALVVITTPNREYNVRYGLAEDEYRHPHHRFEWSRTKFRRWAEGVASRNGYDVECRGIGPRDPLLGSPTQMAVFRAREAP